MNPIAEQRRQINTLLDPTSPTDAPTAYYALYHDATRSTMAVSLDAMGRGNGFAGRFQTGIDLFRPVVCLLCPDPTVAADLLEQVLVVGRPYVLFCRADQLPLVGGSLQTSNERTLSIYALDPSRFTPIVNVLVQTKSAPDGTPRAEIYSGGLQAAAGVNWQSPHFAEIYVQTEAEARQRGWGRSVAAACTEQVLASKRRPLYLVEANNEASIRLAEGLGYYDTGVRQVIADSQYLGHPAKRMAAS